MMKRFFCTVLAMGLAGCGGSGGFTSSPVGGLGEQGNFITTTVEVEQRYLYTLNSGDSTVSGYVYPADEGGEGHGHAHAHGRTLEQQLGEDDHEEVGPEAVELDPSPFDLGPPPIDLGAVSDSYLVTLDANGVVRTYLINGVTGLLELQAELPTNIPNPRRLVVSEGNVAVLGDQIRIYQVSLSGRLSDPAFLDGTSTWVDLKLEGHAAVASTANGAAGFTWHTGRTVDPVFEIALPGGRRGELTYAEAGVFVLNSEDRSLSHLSQGDTGELTLLETFALGSDLTAPTLITSVFDGEDLLVADTDSVALFHPKSGSLEDEGVATLTRPPARLFFLPESEVVYAGHAAGEGSTTILLESTGPEVLGEEGPGGPGPTGFGYIEIVEEITQNSGF